MSLEYPHKIAEKEGCLHKNAKKDGSLSYLVIFCQDAVVRVSLPRCWVSYKLFFSVLTKYTLYCFFAVTKYNAFCSITSQNAVLNFIILVCSQNPFYVLFLVTKQNRWLKNLAITYFIRPFFTTTHFPGRIFLDITHQTCTIFFLSPHRLSP